MITWRRIWLLALLTSAAAAFPARAEVTSDQAAAILIYPRIEATETSDTVIQVTNTSLDPQVLHCFYVDATSHCTADQRACDPFMDPCAGEGSCQPGWIETDFLVYITPRQPLAWTAKHGFADAAIPLDGTFLSGPSGDSNMGTRVPLVSEVPFVGELKCIVVDQNLQPVPNNVIKGEATLVGTIEGGLIDVAKYNAVGIQAINADSNGDNILELGGGSDEYQGCPDTLIVDHFFDFAENPVSGREIFSQLTLVPCTEDFLNQIPGNTTAQFLVFNEFEQRFSTSTPINCFFQRQLSLIDTTNPSRSIFSVFVGGTVTGQTRLRGVQQGLVGVLVFGSPDDDTAAVNLHTQGDRAQPDFITLP